MRIAKIKPDPEHEGKYIRTDYYYTPLGQVVEERYANNLNDKETLATARKYQYVWDIRYIHAAVLRDADTDGDGDVLDEGGSERLYYTQDANFNVTALVETDGDVIERYVYDPYGKRTILDGTWTEITWANSKKNEILFTGHRLNPESGLYYAGARYYHPTLGLWPARERKVYLDGMNQYQYNRNSPIDLVDPSGLSSVEPRPLEPAAPSPAPLQKPADRKDSLPRLSPIVEGTDEEVCTWANVRFDRENPDVVRCGCKVTRDEEAKPYRVAWRPVGEWQEEELPIEYQQKMGENTVQSLDDIEGIAFKSWWRLNQIVWQEAKKGTATILYQGTFALVMHILGATNYLSDEEYAFFFEAKDPYDDYETEKITDFYNGQRYADPNRWGSDPRCDPLDNNWIRDRY